MQKEKTVGAIYASKGPGKKAPRKAIVAVKKPKITRAMKAVETGGAYFRKNKQI